MATISLNDAAPTGDPITFLLANEEIKLGTGEDASFDSDDVTVLANAEAHPWLSVEYPEPSDADAPQAEPAEEPLAGVTAGLDRWDGTDQEKAE